MTSQKTAEFGSAASSVKPIDPHTRFIIVGVIVVGSFIALLNQTVMSPALPALMRDFNITTGHRAVGDQRLHAGLGHHGADFRLSD